MSKSQDMSENNALEETLKILRADYASKLPAVLQTIDEVWQRLQQSWSIPVLEDLHGKVHRIAGAAGSFGFPELGRAAKELEVFLQELHHYTHSASTAEFKTIYDALNNIRRLAEIPTQSTLNVAETPLILSSTPPAKRPKGKLIYLCDDDKELADFLAVHLRHHGYEVIIFNTVDELPYAAKQRPPDALLMDIMLTDDDLAGPRIILNIQKRRQYPLPVIFMSARLDIKARLAAVRANGLAYFTKPVDISGLLYRLDKVTRTIPSGPYRVLIFDDKTNLGEKLAEKLRMGDFQTKTFNKSMQFMNVLDKFSPHLIMVHTQLSAMTGAELVGMIQQQNNFEDIPVIFFASQFDQTTKTVDVSGLGENFIYADINPNNLFSLANHRIKRFLLSRQEREEFIPPDSRRTQDRFTNLYKQRYLLDQVEIACKTLDSKYAPILLYIRLIFDNKDIKTNVLEAFTVEAIHFLEKLVYRLEAVSCLKQNEFALLALERPPENIRALVEFIRSSLEFQCVDPEEGIDVCHCYIGNAICAPPQLPQDILQAAETDCYHKIKPN
jgi:multidomain signaling protein FimX